MYSHYDNLLYLCVLFQRWEELSKTRPQTLYIARCWDSARFVHLPRGRTRGCSWIVFTCLSVQDIQAGFTPCGEGLCWWVTWLFFLWYYEVYWSCSWWSTPANSAIDGGPSSHVTRSHDRRVREVWRNNLLFIFPEYRHFLGENAFVKSVNLPHKITN